MSGINGRLLTILEENEIYKDSLGLSDTFRELGKFIRQPSLEITLSCIEAILQKHNKDVLAEKMRELASIETGVQQFDNNLRDHVAHSLYSFLLGLNFDYYNNNLQIDKVLSWKLAALLHDIAYPIQIFAVAEQRWYAGVDSIESRILRKEPPKRNVEIKDLNIERDEKLPSGKKAFDLINHRVKDRWGLEINVREYYENSLKQGFKDHGVVSALMVLRIIDALYLWYNPNDVERKFIRDGSDWDYRFFKEHILDAVSAIAIHNVPINMLGGKIIYENAPIAYLLVLCDTLQIWSRKSKGRPILDPTSIKLDVEEGNMKVYLDVDDEEYDKIFLEFGKISSDMFTLELLRGDHLYDS